MSAIACPACLEPMELFKSKTGKPYLTCRPCGTQFFVRNPEGVEKFSARHGEDWRKAPAVGASRQVEPKSPNNVLPEVKPEVKPTPQPKPEPVKKGRSLGPLIR